jgi:hypothetical protein
MMPGDQDLTELPDPFRCPECGGMGWWAKYPNNGDPPEQIQCEKCWGTGSLDPRRAVGRSSDRL